jgi:hypothetical protein
MLSISTVVSAQVVLIDREVREIEKKKAILSRLADKDVDEKFVTQRQIDQLEARVKELRSKGAMTLKELTVQEIAKSAAYEERIAAQKFLKRQTSNINW